MSEPQTRPAGIDGSTLPGPYGVGAYAAKLREFLRERSRVQLFGEVWNLRVSRAKVYLELRDADGAVPCSMWRNDFDALALGASALADGAAGRRRRRPGLLRRQPHVVAVVLVSRSSRCGSPARATCSRSSTSCARRSTPRACSRPRSCSRARRCRARSASSRARAARRATTSSRGSRGAAGRDGSCGRSRPSRTATPRHGSRRRCRTSRPPARSTSSSSPAAADRSPTSSASATRRCAARSRCSACR